jgi:futalosine hydrolase
MAPSSRPATLILIPTELELRRIHDLGGLPDELGTVEICGFGPVAAAARTSQLLTRHRPERCLLIGIAGAYDYEQYPAGSALSFARVAIEGVGVGVGADHLGPPRLGFPQWPAHTETGAAIHEELALTKESESDALLLLTTCSASDGPPLAAERRKRFPNASAEDMEGFGVALACRLQETPLSIVRGISNEVGDRDPTRWHIPAALAAGRRRALELLEHTWGAGA